MDGFPERISRATRAGLFVSTLLIAAVVIVLLIALLRVQLS